MVQFLEQWALRRVPQEVGKRGERRQRREVERNKEPPPSQPVTRTLELCPSLQLLSPAVGTEHCQSGTGFQWGQHGFIGYWGSAHTINGVLSLHFPVRRNGTSQSDSVIIIKRSFFFFPSPHTYLIQTASGNFSLYHIKGNRFRRKWGQGGIQFQTHWTITEF